MKFNEKLEANKRPEWAANYIRYKDLKKLIHAKSLKSPPSAVALAVHTLPSTPIPTPVADRRAAPLLGGVSATALASLAEPLIDPLKRNEQPESPRQAPSTIGAEAASAIESLSSRAPPFSKMLAEELRRVESFYLSRFSLLCELFTRYSPELVAHAASQEDRSHDRNSLQRALVEMYRELTQLANYCILNYTGFIKITKKHDKAVEPHLRLGDELNRLLQDLEFSRHASTSELIERLEIAFAAAFSDGNVHVARALLLVRRSKSTSWVQLTLGMRIGFAGALLTWLLWDLIVDTAVLDLPETKRAMWSSVIMNQIPIYRGCGALALGLGMWALTLSTLKRARINYLFLFEWRHEEAMAPPEAAMLATQKLTVLLFCLLLLTKAMLHELPHSTHTGYFTSTLFVFTLVSLLLPPRRGAQLGQSLLRIVLAPAYPVTFWHTFAADVLTSFIKPLVELCYSTCYVVSLEFALPLKEQGGCYAVFYSDSYIVTPILISLPLLFRFLQNLRMYSDSGKRFPALANALKYAVALLVVFFGALHQIDRRQPTPGGQWIQVAWVGAYLAATLYAFAWDVLMDWRLLSGPCEIRSTHMIFRSDAWYKAAIAVDFVLRFAWTATLAPGFLSDRMVADMGKQIITMAAVVLEIVRRSMWAVLRLEAEHLYNTEGWRRIDEVPMHFDRKQQPAEAASPSAEGTNKSSKELALELLAYVTVLGLLAAFSVLTRPSPSSA